MKKFLNKIFGSNEEENMMDSTMAAEEEDTAEGQLALDVYQTKDNLMIKSTMAGVKPEDLDITIDNDQVVIKGERKQAEEVSGDDYLLQECYWGSFYRAFDLPTDVDPDKAVADIKDGILTITLPKTSRSRAKKVRVKQQTEAE